MKIHVYRDLEAQGKAAAALFAAQILKKPDSVLGFATGSTPLRTYAALADLYAQGALDFSRMYTNLFSKVNIPAENYRLPNGLAADIDRECTEYEAAIEAAGGIDLQFLGIGHDGHIGFNEPCGEFPKATHCVALTPMTIEANKRFFASADEVPRRAISMGIGTIMRARGVVLVIYGADKAEITARALKGPVTPQVPASILQYHPNCTVLLDEAAAAEL